MPVASPFRLDDSGTFSYRDGVLRAGSTCPSAQRRRLSNLPTDVSHWG